MKLMMLFLLVLGSVAFAASQVDTECQQQCCTEFGGTWNDQCTGNVTTVSYNSCVQTCTQVASGNCCGATAILLAIPTLAFLKSRQ